MVIIFIKRALLIAVTIGCVFASAAEMEPNLAEPTKTWAMVVGGVNRDPEERQAKDKAVIKLRKFLTKDAKVTADCLKILVDRNSFARRGGEISTAENLKRSIGELAAGIEAGDRFIFYYTGQANIVKGVLRLNLPGEDVTCGQLAKWLSEIKASVVTVVMDCPGAGLGVKMLKGQGRIVVCGARSDQPYSTRFSEYFVPALRNGESDTNGDGRISLLEAFTLASKQIDDLYREQNLLKTETALLEDDGDGVPSQRPWRYKETGKDGLAASKLFFVIQKQPDKL